MANFRQKYKQQKEDLMRRQQESMNNRDENKFSGIIDMEKVPKGMQIWNYPSDEHIINYIIFEAGNNMPKLFEGRTDISPVEEGDLCWSIDLHMHRKQGPNNNMDFVCPAKTNGKPCPICEYIKNHDGPLPKDQWNELKPKHYTMHLVWVTTNEEESKKGVQIWQVPYHFMEKEMKLISRLKTKGGGIVQYYVPEAGVGRYVIFTVDKQDSGWSFGSPHFEELTEDIPDEILNQSFDLDSVIKYASYEEIYKAFYGTDFEDGEETPIGSTEERTASVNEESEASSNPPRKEPDPEPEQHEEELEFSENECPCGGDFGADHEELENCSADGGCPNWDDCYAAKQEMEAAQIPEPEPEKPAPIRKPDRKKPVRRPIRRK